MKQMSSVVCAAIVRSILRATLVVGAVAIFAALPLASPAQTPGALPTAPGAGERAGIGGYTEAKASLPGENGSPLEPYLFLFILAGGGVIGWVLAITTDIRVRRGRPGAYF
jgi:hypothetical protein